MANHKRNRREHDKHKPVLQNALNHRPNDSAVPFTSSESEEILETEGITIEIDDQSEHLDIGSTSVIQEDVFVEIKGITEDVDHQEVLVTFNDVDADATANILYYQQNELPRQTVQRAPTPAQELDDLLNSLRTIFIHDREIASRTDAGRCGICYLMHPLEVLHYLEQDGLYVCPTCQHALKNQQFPMLRRQRK